MPKANAHFLQVQIDIFQFGAIQVEPRRMRAPVAARLNAEQELSVQKLFPRLFNNNELMP